jgi:hypothetical protein
MIAVVKEQGRVEFEELLPAIKKQARVAFRAQPASEREELVAETIANCFVAYKRLIERGLLDVIYSTPLASYAIKQIRSGRRVGSKLNIRDASSPYCQRNKSVVMDHLDRLDATGGEWREVVVEDKTAGPADIAATRIDFSDWLASLSGKQRRIAKTLATGETTSVAARKFRISRGRISQLRRELMDAWLEFQGELSVA